MTWEERLFSVLDDLEQQAEGLWAAERDLELADRARSEYSHVSAASRLMATVGGTVTLHVRGVGPLVGELRRVADGWCLLSARGGQWIVRLEAVALASGVSPRSDPEAAWPVTAKLGLGSALRRIAASVEPCQLVLLDGSRYDVRLVRVGRDFVEAVVGEADRPTVFWFHGLAAVRQPDH